MTTTTTTPTLPVTASMLGDPEAHHCGDASVSCPDALVPCGGDDLEWVPTIEAVVVPLEQRELCLRCPARRWCLATAITTRSDGYWAGTTTAQRQALQREGRVTVEAVDARQVQEQPTHRPGQGSLLLYRRDRCRCPECRRANADAKFEQRSRVRLLTGGVAA